MSARPSRTAPASELETPPRDERRRRQLVDAAIESIATYGLSRTTIARVAGLAGLSTGIVNFYFQGKDALLLATLETVDAQYLLRQRDAIRDYSADPVGRLNAMIAAAFDPEICIPSRVAVWAAFWGEAGSRDDYMRICAAREAELEATSVGAFQEIARVGGYSHLVPEALGRAFHHLLASIPESMLGDEAPFDLVGARATCRGFLSSVFPHEFSGEPPRLEEKPASLPLECAGPDEGFQTLPTWVYNDREFYELEKENIFARQWILLGHISQVEKPGDYITADLMEEQILVIRGRDGRLRALDNVCRHRASRLVAGISGHCSGSLVCPYHGWRYELDGKLAGVPSESTFDGLDKSKIRLPELNLEEWMGFIFVRFSAEGASVAESMGAYTEDAALYKFQDMQPLGESRVLECDFNWKLFVENDSEGYHIRAGHPGLSRLFGSDYNEAIDGDVGSQAFSTLAQEESPVWAEASYQRLLPEVPHLPDRLQRAWAYFGLFPGAVVQASPDVADCYQVLPTGPESCRLLTFRVALADARREMRAARYLSSRIVRNVINEDLTLCRSTNEGIKSGRYVGGYLSSRESGVRAFQQKIRELIPVATQEEKPAEGRVASSNSLLRAARGRQRAGAELSPSRASS
ncbi:MAG: SRPBCC family protein [Myxococcota bacterium]|nr:SRPBCC family protein [Myxococcota bacterium]